MDSEDYQALRQSQREVKKRRHDRNIEMIEFECARMLLSFKRMQDYHIRIEHSSGKSLDFFTLSNKATWVGSNKWFQIQDIGEFLIKNFKS